MIFKEIIVRSTIGDNDFVESSCKRHEKLIEEV